jgi:hypothetical protein
LTVVVVSVSELCRSPIEDVVVSTTMVAAVMVPVLAMVTVPSAMRTSVPRGSESLHWKQSDRCDYENQGEVAKHNDLLRHRSTSATLSGWVFWL